MTLPTGDPMSIDLERVRDRIERIRQTFVAQMEAWLELMPPDMRTQPFVGLAGGETLTPEAMVTEVRNGTEWGDRFLDNAIALMAAKHLQQPSMSPNDASLEATHAAYGAAFKKFPGE